MWGADQADHPTSDLDARDGDLAEKLRKWIERLVEKIGKLGGDVAGE